MKLNLSLSDKAAKEIRQAAKVQKKAVSTIVEEAWSQARGKVLAFKAPSNEKLEKQKAQAMKLLKGVAGCLRPYYDKEMDSVTLQKEAFHHLQKKHLKKISKN